MPESGSSCLGDSVPVCVCRPPAGIHSCLPRECCQGCSPRPSWLPASALNASCRSEVAPFTPYAIAPEQSCASLLFLLAIDAVSLEALFSFACINVSVCADPGDDGKGDLRRTHGLRQAAVQAVRDQGDLQRHRSDSHERCSSKTHSRAADMCNKLISS